MKYKSEKELKPVMGAFAAMARHNAFLTLMDIMDQLHIRQREITFLDRNGNERKVEDLEAVIWKLDLFSKNNVLTAEQQNGAIRLLQRHFPFLNLLPDQAYPNLCKKLIAAINTLSHIRDIHLHYCTLDDKINDKWQRRFEEETGVLLATILKAAPRALKDKYKETGLLGNEELAFVTDKQFVKKGDKYLINENWPFNPSRHPFESENEQPYDRLSTFGVIMLISLFTERRYTFDFLKGCGLMDYFREVGENGHLSQQRIIKELLSFYSIRLPERKLDIELDSAQVKLDMLNELAKCPSELYDVLPEEGKSSFETTATDGTPILLKRYSDRYTPLILKYFDTTKAFNKLRFHINAGKLRYTYHGEKEYMDGCSRERIVQDEINGFRRIQEVEKERTQNDSFLGYPLLKKDEEGNTPDMPFITDSGTRYILNGELIGISLRGDVLPSIEKRTHTDGIRFKVKTGNPDCWLSKYELPAMAFYHYLSQKYKIQKSVEDILSETVTKYRDFFEGVAEGRIHSLDGIDIPNRLIPEKIRDFLSGKKSKDLDIHLFKRQTIASLIAETKERRERIIEDLKTIKSKENRLGKKSFVRILPGKLADFLAEDIVRFQSFPEGHPERKLTGKQYSILQGLIAICSEELEQSCERAGLLNCPTSHPFLNRVFNHRDDIHSTVDFYMFYLQERLRYLEGDIPDNAPFLHLNRLRWSGQKDEMYYRNLAKRYYKDPSTGDYSGIFLPRGLFEGEIRQIIKDHCSKTEKQLTQCERVNTSFIVLSFIEKELDDQNQGFYYDHYDYGMGEYGFHRLAAKMSKQALSSILRKEQEKNGNNTLYCQEIEAILRNHPTPSKGVTGSQDELSSKLRTLYNRMCDNEKAIRRYMVQDITLFLLARDIIGKAGDSLLLAEVGPQGQGLLDQKVDVITNVKNKMIKQESILVKDYGELFRVLRDKRIDTLFKNLDSGTVIPFDILKQELAEYDDERVPMVTKILDYEKRICDAHPGKLDARQRHDFKDVLDADEHMSPLQKEGIKRSRNAFSHNQYPMPKVWVPGHREEILELYEPNLPKIATRISAKTDELLAGESK